MENRRKLRKNVFPSQSHNLSKFIFRHCWSKAYSPTSRPMPTAGIFRFPTQFVCFRFSVFNFYSPFIFKVCFQALLVLSPLANVKANAESVFFRFPLQIGLFSFLFSLVYYATSIDCLRQARMFLFGPGICHQRTSAAAACETRAAPELHPAGNHLCC